MNEVRQPVIGGSHGTIPHHRQADRTLEDSGTEQNGEQLLHPERTTQHEYLVVTG